MKAKMIVALIVAVCMLSPVADAQRIKVEELRKDNGIESVYLSKPMLKMASKYLKRKTDISINTSLLDGMYIFSTDMNRSSSAALIRRTFSPIMGGSRKDYEELMSVQDGNERIGFYAEKGKKNTFRTLVLHGGCGGNTCTCHGRDIHARAARSNDLSQWPFALFPQGVECFEA